MVDRSPKVVILCGGRGMRLSQETEYKPKSLVEIGGRPIIWHIMKIYSHYGYRDFVLCLGYRGRMIKDYFAHFDILNNDVTISVGRESATEVHEIPACDNWRVTLADTGQEAMTGARVKRVEKYIDSDVFMLTYGDGVADINVDELMKFHRGHGRLGTVTATAPISRFGELCVQGDQAMSFCEKPRGTDTWINGGFFVFSRGFLEYLTDEDGCILETAPLEKLARDGQLMAYKHRGFWHCMDTMRDFNALNALCRENEAPWRTWV